MRRIDHVPGEAEAQLREKTLGLPDGAALSAQRQQLVSSFNIKNLCVQAVVQASAGKPWTPADINEAIAYVYAFMSDHADQGNR